MKKIKLILKVSIVLVFFATPSLVSGGGTCTMTVSDENDGSCQPEYKWTMEGRVIDGYFCEQGQVNQHGLFDCGIEVLAGV